MSPSVHGLTVAAALAASLLGASTARSAEPSRAALDAMIARHAEANRVPLALVHRVVKRESSYNPRASSKGNFGLMQIRHGTARGLGYGGSAAGLLDAETNLRYAVPYLAGAYKVADGNHDRAVALYSRGYYYEAKRRGLAAKRVSSEPVEEAQAPSAPAAPAEAPSWLAALFGGGTASAPEAVEAQASPSLAEAAPVEDAAEPAAAAVEKPRRKRTGSAQRKPAPVKPQVADRAEGQGRS